MRRAKIVDRPASQKLGEPGHLGRASLAILALWALMFAPQLFQARAYVIGDAGAIRAFAEFSGDRWRETHQRTHWNPYVFAGVPATASLQDSRPQWLPDRLLDAFDAIHRLPGFPPLAIPLLVHLAGMVAMGALARRLWSSGTPAMIWAAFAWGLLPALLVPFSFGQDWLLMSAALVPVVLLSVLRVGAASAPGERMSAGVGMALATAAILLAAHPQIVALAIPLCGAFAVERMVTSRRVASLIDLAAAVALGAAMAAAVWWPAHFYSTHSVRGGGATILSEVARWSAGAGDLLALAWPWAAGFGGATYWGGLQTTDFPTYSGLSVCVLGLIGLLGRGPERRSAWLLGALAALGIVLALGLRLGPLYHWIYVRVPLWSAFRVAIRSLLLAQLGLALLSARGFELAVRDARRAPKKWLGIALGTALGGLALAAVLRASSGYAGAVHGARPRLDGGAVHLLVQQATHDLGERAVLFALLLVAIVLAARGNAKRIGAGAIAIGLLAHDLGTVSLPFLERASGPLDRLDRPPLPAIARLAARDSTRVLDVSRERVSSNDWIRWRVRSFTGNHPAVPRTWDDLWGRGLQRNYPVLCAFGVGYLGGADPEPPDTSRFENVGVDSVTGIPIWRIRRALPRAYAAHRVIRLADDAAVLAALERRELDPLEEVYTTANGVEGRYASRCGVRWLRDDPDRLELETSADSTAFLVVADTWLPGWTLEVDGQPRPIVRVQHLIRGLVLPAGTHRVSLAYEPEGWPAGVRWSRAGWALWLLGLLGVVFWRRSSPPPQPDDGPRHAGPVEGETRKRPQRR